MNRASTRDWSGRGGVVLLCAALAGCLPDLGECDYEAATQLVFQRDVRSVENPANGEVLYAGQALVLRSCGNARYCHSQEAVGEARYGVPAGFDFDVSVACAGDGPCPDAERARLARSHATVVGHARELLGSVLAGTMPPGGRAEDYVLSTSYFYEAHDGEALVACGEDCLAESLHLDGGTPLPDIHTAEGRDLLRNWLSCGAPTIERNVDPVVDPPGAPCSDVDARTGDCVVRALPAPSVGP